MDLSSVFFVLCFMSVIKIAGFFLFIFLDMQFVSITKYNPIYATHPLLFLLLLMHAHSVPTLLMYFSVQRYTILDMMLTSITSVLDACVALNMNLNYCMLINEC